MNAYASRKHESYSIEVLAVFFKNPERLNSSLKHLEYVIRTEKNHSDNGIEYFLENSPFVKTQICIDESFLKMKMLNRSIKTEVSISIFSLKYCSFFPEFLHFQIQNYKTK